MHENYADVKEEMMESTCPGVHQSGSGQAENRVELFSFESGRIYREHNHSDLPLLRYEVSCCERVYLQPSFLLVFRLASHTP